jgi:hypothetical protein
MVSPLIHSSGKSGGGGGGHTIKDEGTSLTQRTNLNFVGAGVTVTDDAGNDASVVTIPGGGGGHMITGSFYAVPESTTVPKLIIGPMPFAGTFVKLTIKSYDVAAESAIRVDLHKQAAADENTNTSTTVFTTQTNRPTIASGSYAGNTTTFEVSTFAKGDWLYFFLDVDDSGITVIQFGLEVTPT